MCPADRTDELGRDDIVLAVPVSYAQQRLWFLDQFDPGTALYNIPMAWRLHGPLNIHALHASLQQLVNRHESLRTTFAAPDGLPLQVVAEHLELPLPLIDLSSKEQAIARTEARRLQQEEAEQAFDLERGPLLRASLIELAIEEHLLLLTLHHVICDGWSLGVLQSELSKLYQSYCTGEEPQLPELPIQYADYAVWQREWLEGEAIREHLSYWTEYLRDAPRALELPTDKARPTSLSHAGEVVEFSLGEELSRGVRRLSRRLRATPFMVLAAVFEVMLHRYSGQEQLCIGYPVANRRRVELEEVVGFFVNMLVLRVEVRGELRFEELVEEVREAVLDGERHEEMPFEKLVEELRPDRDLSRQPLFQVLFTHEGLSSNGLQLYGLRSTALPPTYNTAKFDLSLFICETQERWEGAFEYATDLFERATIERMVGHFQTLLEAVIKQPQARIRDLPLLTMDERRQLLVEWNQTQSAQEEQRLQEMFETQAELHAEAVAVVSGGRRMSYRELNERANQVAHALRQMGVGPEKAVGVCLERGEDLVVGMLGVLKAGGAYVPLDADYPSDRLAFMIDDSRATVLLTQESLVKKLPEHRARQVYLDSIWESTAHPNLENPSVLTTPDNLAYIIYTSGSTGRPKGVEVPHRGLLNLVVWHQHFYQLTLADRATQLAGLSFDASVWETWPYLCAGACLYPVDEEIGRSPAQLVHLLTQESITYCFVPTPMAKAVLEETWPDDIALKALLTGGDKLHHGAGHDRRFRLVNHYGPTESSVVTTCCEVGASLETGESPLIGRPISNLKVYILDCYGQPAPIGVAGELHIGGVGLARGYLNRPDLTAEKFIPDPFSIEGGTRLYRTGDRVRYRANGEIEFLGRIDRQVKVRGYRIEPGEIETVLATHVTVRECIVVAIERADHEKHLVAYVVTEKGAQGDVPSWRRYLQAILPRHMVPATFVLLDKLPLLANGKIDRSGLPAPEQWGFRREQDYVAPRNALEETVAKIWSDLLGIERVGIHDNFFELGGQSLLVIQVISRIRQALDINVQIRTLFTNPTIAELCENIEMLRWLTQEPPVALDDETQQQREVGEI